MIIAVSATGKDLNSELNPRFGRCEYFIIVDTNDMSFNAYENENSELSSGAGIQSAGFVASKGVDVVLTGNCGPKADQTFSAAGVKVLTGFSGTVQHALDQFNTGGKIHPKDVPAGDSTSRGPGGMGRGMGMGGGKCMGGKGKGMGRGMATAWPSSSLGSKEEELSSLKKQAELLKHQLENLTDRIKELE